MALGRLLEQCICETASNVEAQCSAHNASHLVHVSIHGLNKWVMPGAHSLNLITCQPLRILPAAWLKLTFTSFAYYFVFVFMGKHGMLVNKALSQIIPLFIYGFYKSWLFSSLTLWSKIDLFWNHTKSIQAI